MNDQPDTDPRAAIPPMARLKAMRVGMLMKPHAIFKGDKPRKGSTFTFAQADGSLWAGKVLTAVDLDGEIIVEFDGPLTSA